MPRRQEVLAHYAEFDGFSYPPSQPRIGTAIPGHALIRQRSHTIERHVPIHAMREADLRPNLKTVLRSVSRNPSDRHVLTGCVRTHSHLQEGVAGTDSPAPSNIPIGKNLRAIGASVRLIIRDFRGHEM